MKRIEPIPSPLRDSFPKFFPDKALPSSMNKKSSNIFHCMQSLGMLCLLKHSYSLQHGNSLLICIQNCTPPGQVSVQINIDALKRPAQADIQQPICEDLQGLGVLTHMKFTPSRRRCMLRQDFEDQPLVFDSADVSSLFWMPLLPTPYLRSQSI